VARDSERAPGADARDESAGCFIKWFSDITLDDVALVGGKNASLGEMYRELTPRGVKVPGGFAITAEAYRHLLREAGLEEEKVLSDRHPRQPWRPADPG
jgi:phosphoenolpyruvate synthase/pyruvate phosphate dikinase